MGNNLRRMIGRRATNWRTGEPANRMWFDKITGRAAADGADCNTIPRRFASGLPSGLLSLLHRFIAPPSALSPFSVMPLRHAILLTAGFTLLLWLLPGHLLRQQRALPRWAALQELGWAR